MEYGEPDDEYQPDIAYARKTRLSQVLHEEGQKFRYIYDYGDNWEHEIEVEEISEPEPNVFYPVCIGGERAFPPEDVGGVSGYEDFLEIIHDPEHEEHDYMVSWSDGLNPEMFDLRSVNRELRRHAQHWPVSFSVSPHRGLVPLPTVSSIDRCVAIIRPRKPFLDWLQGLPDWDMDVTLKDIKSDCMAILIPESDSIEEALGYIEHNYHTFFEMQLHDWCRNSSLWPKKLTLSMFRRWFNVEIHSMVHDALNEELYREWPIRTRDLSRMRRKRWQP